MTKSTWCQCLDKGWCHGTLCRGFLLGIGIGYAEAMIRAKLQQALPVLADLANSKEAQAGRPRVMFSAYCGVRVRVSLKRTR